MAGEYTPGPWVIEPCPDGLDIYSPRGRIAMINLDEPEEGNDLTANARLIAAAPDLLAALSDIVASSDANCGDSLANAIETARAAITKARGASC